MRTSSSNVVPVIHHDYEDRVPTFDRPDFRPYQRKVEKLMSKEPITVAEIHRRLGADADRAKTMDALETSDVCECVPGALLDRWKKRRKRVFIEAPIMHMGISPRAFENE